MEIVQEDSEWAARKVTPACRPISYKISRRKGGIGAKFATLRAEGGEEGEKSRREWAA